MKTKIETPTIEQSKAERAALVAVAEAAQRVMDGSPRLYAHDGASRVFDCVDALAALAAARGN